MSNVRVPAIDLSGRPFHFIGIGGIGMSALAHVLAARQLPVSGSDLRSTHITQRLRAAGARIFERQVGQNLDYCCAGGDRVDAGARESLPQVVCSTAISPENDEYRAALARGCPIYHRSDVLAALMGEAEQSVAVAGTHGKTTTSSAIAYVLLEAGLDPTIVVGGEVEAWNGNARAGDSDLLVAEADESDGSLTKLAPHIGIVTNIELDHPDHFTALEDVMGIFQRFAEQCDTLVGCSDWATVRQLRPGITYGFDPAHDPDYTATNVTFHPWGTTAEIWERGMSLGTLTLRLLGEHNLSNALAVVAVARALGVEFASIAQSLSQFTGTKRRFEVCGEAGGITFVDDYAHHPSEIRATLAAARLRQASIHGTRRVVAIFQPHRYSRTEAFLDEFATAFADADLAIATEIYAAGEQPRAVTGRDLAEAIARHHPQVLFQPDLDTLSAKLATLLQPGDLAIYLGAGNLNRTIPEAIALLGTPREAA